MSHEFKTPLTVVLSSLQLLRRRLCRPGKDIADGVEKYLDYAEQNLYKTLRLAANILDAQYADVKNVQTEEYTDLAAALAETVEGARPYAQACGVTLRFENRSKGPCGLLCDTQRLDRIVLNLLSNALKHTPGAARCSFCWRGMGCMRVSLWRTMVAVFPSRRCRTCLKNSGAGRESGEAPVWGCILRSSLHGCRGEKFMRKTGRSAVRVLS